MVWPQLQMTGHAAPSLSSNLAITVITIFAGVNQYLAQFWHTHCAKQWLIVVNGDECCARKKPLTH